jgi:hypothetical protein
MSIHLYFSLIPEALIASMLTPEQFGQYYATGFKFKSKGQALFFEVDPAFRHPYFDIDGCYKRCKAKPDGSPKNSVYVSMYRVLEHLSVAAIGKLYLTTAMGATLGLNAARRCRPTRRELHMYQTLAPKNSLVVSSLAPSVYYADITTKPSHSSRSRACVSLNSSWGGWRPTLKAARKVTCPTPSCSTCAKRCSRSPTRTNPTSWCTACTRSSSPTGWSRTASTWASADEVSQLSASPIPVSWMANSALLSVSVLPYRTFPTRFNWPAAENAAALVKENGNEGVIDRGRRRIRIDGRQVDPGPGRVRSR